MKATLARALSLLAAAALLACTGTEVPEIFVCHLDSECGPDEVCFKEGCGDPGKDLAVEVVPSPTNGQHAQDFLIDDLRPTEDFELFGPSQLDGAVRRMSNGGVDQAYQGKVSFLISGESLLIPGLTRRYEATVLPDRGAYAVPVGVGRFNVTLTPLDPEVPATTLRDVPVEGGQAVTVVWSLPSAAELVSISGKLVLTLATGPATVAMQIQALDPVSQRPLSQRVPVASSGDFTVSVSPEVNRLSSVVLLASPTNPASMVPQKAFSVPVVATKLPRPPLELGDFGAPVRVSGRVVNKGAAAVPLASVYVEGKVRGGGTFRSAVVRTDVEGAFELQTLASDPAADASLWVVSPPRTTTGLLRKSIPIPTAGGPLGAFTVPDKVVAIGTITRAEGPVAPGVRVVAEPVGALEAYPLPPEGDDVTSDANGEFQLHLDPASYRLDFFPSERLPRVSRLITLRPQLTSAGEPEPFRLPPFGLSKGRTVYGKVIALPNRITTTQQAAPYATVRFFRLVSSQGQPTAYLLGEAVTDANASYSLILPTK